MILGVLTDLLRELDIDCTSPDQFLEADLRLDFEERQCIREDIEERLHVVISDDEIEFDLTILDLAGLLSRKLLTKPGPVTCDGGLQEDIVIRASSETVRRSLLDVEAWPLVLAHVRYVRVTYDDGIHKEFTMDVRGRDGKFMPVRSVHRIEPCRIAYFDPEPACFLKHHCGDWFMNALSENATHLTLVQRWTLSPQADRMFRTCDGMSASRQVAALLREQARVGLLAWKQHLEPPSRIQHRERSSKNSDVGSLIESG
jgi:hypothetical protein